MSLCKGAPPFLFGSPWLSVSRSGPVKLHAHDCGHCSQFRTKERASLSADVQRAGRLRTREKQASEGHPRFSDLFGCLLALGQALRVGTAMGSGLQVASPQPLPGPHLCSLPSGFPPTGFGWQGNLQRARRLREEGRRCWLVAPSLEGPQGWPVLGRTLQLLSGVLGHTANYHLLLPAQASSPEGGPLLCPARCLRPVKIPSVYILFVLLGSNGLNVSSLSFLDPD